MKSRCNSTALYEIWVGEQLKKALGETALPTSTGLGCFRYRRGLRSPVPAWVNPQHSSDHPQRQAHWWRDFSRTLLQRCGYARRPIGEPILPWSMEHRFVEE